MKLNSKVIAGFFVSFIALATSARADSVVFDVNLPIGNGSVTGTITTDGTLGTIGLSNITGLNLTMNGPLSSADSTSLSDFYAFAGNDLSETATELIFNFSGSPNSGFTLLTDGPNYSEALSIGGGNYITGICGNVNCDPNNTPGLELDSRSAPVYYSQLSGDVVLGTATPEPGALFLLSTGLIGFGAMRTRRSQLRQK